MNTRFALSRLIAAVLMLTLLSACATMSSGKPAHGDKHRASSSEESASGGQVITLASTIEKNRLSVSYSLALARRGAQDDQLRLTLLFRNLLDQDRAVHAHVTVTDAQGRVLRALAPDAALGADVQWLKHSFEIPAQGIEMGEALYRAKSFSFPLTISVVAGKDRFEFTANRP